MNFKAGIPEYRGYTCENCRSLELSDALTALSFIIIAVLIRLAVKKIKS